MSEDYQPAKKNERFLDYLHRLQQAYQERNNGKKNSFFEKYLRMPRNGVNPVHQAVEEAKQIDVNQQTIEALIEKARTTGEWFEAYEKAREAIDKAVGIYCSKLASTESGQGHDAALTHLNPKRDADLISHILFIHPEVRKEFGGRFENLYRAVLRYDGRLPKSERDYNPPKNGCGTQEAHKEHSKVLSDVLEDLIRELPSEVFSHKDEHYDSVRKVIRKKATREAYFFFKDDPQQGIDFLLQSIGQEQNENIKWVYDDVLNHFKGYMKLDFIDQNMQFRDPVTGKQGGFPSMHQRIGVYHALHAQRFGILDGCGTGKTAIGALLYPLVKNKKLQEGKKMHNRMVVVGTIPCYKTWRRGFEGKDRERYMAESKNVVLINGHSKDDELYEKLKQAEIIFVNYQQLTKDFKVNGEQKAVYKILAEMGYDLLVFDEVHNIKNRKNVTATGKENYSWAARYLSMQDKEAFFLLLSGTPMPDNLRDYANIYHMLRPDKCENPEKFVETIDDVSYNPHTLASFVDENTLRRKAEEVNQLLEIDQDWYDDIEISPVQREIHDYLTSHRPNDWATERRKTLLDPRLVHPRYLQRLGLVGKVTSRDSSKYKRLEELLTTEGGPLRPGRDEKGNDKPLEKFVIFSSALKEGITRVTKKLKLEYEKMGLGKEYEALGLDDDCLEKRLNTAIKRLPGFEKKYIKVIDGSVDTVAREELATKFKDDPNLVGLLCTTKTGGESLDFSHATYAYFLDEDYSPATTEQAIARLQRRGQSRQVKVRVFRGKDTFEQVITNYVERKSRAIKIMLDGLPPDDEELEFLTKDPEAKLSQMIQQRFGGIAIDASKYVDLKLSDVVIKVSNKVKQDGAGSGLGNNYDTTRAQEIAMRIGKDARCWFDPQFAQYYADSFGELSPYIIHRMKIMDLVKRAQRNEIKFPRKVLSTASGPSILWGAYQSLEEVIQNNGMKMPRIHDLDYSAYMLKHGKNPHKIVSDMRQIAANDGTYDMVDNASISLLNGSREDPKEVLQTLRESNRVLKKGGLLELSVKSLYFMDGWYKALEQLGFEVLTQPRAGFGLSKPGYKKLVEEHGLGFAVACKRKLEKSHFILARKVKAPQEKIDVKDLWFLTELGEDYHLSTDETKAAIPPAEESAVYKRKRYIRFKSKPAPKEQGPNYSKPYVVNKDGTVDTVS